MGFRMTWLATQDAEEAAILDRLNLQVSGEAEDYLAADYALAHLPGGWLVIVSSKEARFDKLAPKAVSEGFVMTAWINETVMVSEARGFRDGAPEWSVVHNPDVDPNGVRVEGTPPEAFAEIYRRLQADEAEETGPVDHFFDVPVQLTEQICGFVHNIDMGVTWKTLAARRAPKTEGKGFFARLFGR